MSLKSWVFGNPDHLKELRKLREEQELKEKGKKYLVTVDYTEIITTDDSVEIEVFAVDEDQAEQLATEQFYEEHDGDTFEIQGCDIEEIPEEEDADKSTLDLF